MTYSMINVCGGLRVEIEEYFTTLISKNIDFQIILQQIISTT